MNTNRFAMVKSSPTVPDFNVQPEKPRYIELAERYATAQGMTHAPWWLIDLFRNKANS